MVSRDPDRLEAELRQAEFDGDPDVLRALRSEAQRTIDYQTAAIEDMDTKAAKLFRMNLVLLGLIISAISLGPQVFDSSPPGEVRSLVNVYLEAGVGFLITSTVVAAVTYSTTDLDVGLGVDNTAKFLDSSMDAGGANEAMLYGYVRRMNWNHHANVRIAPLLSLTICASVAGIISLTVGAYHVVHGSAPWWLLAVSVVFIGSAIHYTGLLSSIRRTIAEPDMDD